MAAYVFLSCPQIIKRHYVVIKEILGKTILGMFSNSHKFTQFKTKKISISNLQMNRGKKFFLQN